MMENKSILIAYLVTWSLYVIGVHVFGKWKRLEKTNIVLSHSVPSAVAISMTFIFLIGHGATVRQFVANSDRGMDLWSLWVSLWPLLLFATFGSGLAQAVLTIVALFKREWRVWAPITALGAGMSAFSFMAVGINFPDA
ncbi:MAG: hypothetical protein FJ302_04720 [Planctomycetes bacterium]|nr:hypothetical protein [Planctomycetota bacterium]